MADMAYHLSMRQSSFLIFPVALALMLCCMSGSDSPAHAQTPGEAQQKCIALDGVADWGAIDKLTMWLSPADAPDTRYVLEMMPGCLYLRYADTLALAADTTRLCEDGGDVVLLNDSLCRTQRMMPWAQWQAKAP